MTRSANVEEFKLVNNFHSLRKTLLEEKYKDRLDKPLAYWALPNDRRLPMAFLGRTLQELLATPFESLSATPGIGQKKINSLVKLLARATKDQAPPMLYSAGESGGQKRISGQSKADRTVGFDPALVSEALWVQWRENIIRHDVEQEKLGRLAPALQALPTVIWHTSLSAYTGHSLAEIRQLKTHGEKRVRAILHVFYAVHEFFLHAPPESHLTLRLAPRFVLPIERWIAETLERTTPPTGQELRAAVARPLIEQLQIDSGPAVAQLAESRLGLHGDPQSVRQQSRRMGVTRARVYQLLEDCSKVMDVRWPEGRKLLKKLADHCLELGVPAADLSLLNELVELFYPDEEAAQLTAGAA